MRRNRPTIVDVARHAGLSKSTVSAALRRERGVAPATAERVFAAVRELGYRPLRQGAASRQRVIGVAVRHVENPHFSELTSEMERACRTAGHRMVLAPGLRESTDYERQFDTLIDVGCDALVVLSGAVPLQAIDLASREVPVVVVGRSAFEIPTVDTIVSDDRAGAALAVEHLRSLGHTSIAFVTASQRPTAIERYAAYRTSMRAAGLGVAQVHLEEGADVVADLRALGITGAFTDNDATAFELMTEALDAGLRIPEDLSIVGFDGVSLGGRIRPRLTSVHQPRNEIATLAMQLVGERLAGREEARVVSVDPSLVVQDSTARAGTQRP